MVGLDEDGRSLFANDAARRMSAQDDGLALDRSGRLYAADRAANQRLAELQRDVAAGGSGGLARIARPQGKPAYVVLVAPLARGEGLDGQRRRGTLFVIHDPLHRVPPMPQLVAELFRIPLGSATLLAALASGEELNAYAERAGISMNTVRFHLKTAYARTGVRRQSDLVRLITAALRDLAEHRDQTAVRPSLLGWGLVSSSQRIGEGTSEGFNPPGLAPCGATRCRSDLDQNSAESPRFLGF